MLNKNNGALHRVLNIVMKELCKDSYSDSIFPHKLEESDFGDMGCLKKCQNK